MGWEIQFLGIALPSGDYKSVLLENTPVADQLIIINGNGVYTLCRIVSADISLKLALLERVRRIRDQEIEEYTDLVINHNQAIEIEAGNAEEFICGYCRNHTVGFNGRDNVCSHCGVIYYAPL